MKCVATGGLFEMTSRNFSREKGERILEEMDSQRSAWSAQNNESLAPGMKNCFSAHLPSKAFNVPSAPPTHSINQPYPPPYSPQAPYQYQGTIQFFAIF